jgi:hypothetical protein
MNGSVDAILYQESKATTRDQALSSVMTADEKQVYQAFANRIEGSCTVIFKNVEFAQAIRAVARRQGIYKS